MSNPSASVWTFSESIPTDHVMVSGGASYGKTVREAPQEKQGNERATEQGRADRNQS